MISPACPELLLSAPVPGTGPCLLRMEVTQAWNESGMMAMVDAMGLLAQASVHGAFPIPDVQPGASGLRLQRIRVESPRSLLFELQTRAAELCVNRFEAAEGAWHALLNMLDACWPQASRIARVEID